MTSLLRSLWGKNDGCAEQYICASELFLLSVMSQSYSAITYWGISAPGHVKELVYGINEIDKRYKYQIVYNIQLPGLKLIDSHMQMQTSN